MWIIWPFKKKNFGEAWTVCADFSRHIEPSIGKYLIQDQSALPHPKAVIHEKICVLLMIETNAKILETIRSCAFELPFYQEGVGPDALHPLGIDLDRHKDGPESLQASVAADPIGKEKYDRFKRLRDAEWAKIKAFMAAAEAKRGRTAA